MYQLTAKPDNDAGSEAILIGLERGERVGRIELPYSAWKSNGDGSNESREVALGRIVERNASEEPDSYATRICLFLERHVASLLYPRNQYSGLITLGKYAAIVLTTLVILAPAASAKQKRLPPHWKQWLQTCHAEQPKPGTNSTRGHWNNIWWHQTVNYTYPGGCGFTQANWDAHKRPGQPKYMSQASPLEQLWACERIYQHYAAIGGPAYGASVWDANKTIGFYGFAEGE